VAKVRISKQAIDQAMQAAQLLSSPVRLYDDNLKGFGFTAAKSGGGSFFIEYRLASRGTAKQRYTLGAAGPLTPASAREIAQQLLGSVARGIDIQAAKEAERAKAAGMRFSELCAAYFDFRDDGSRYWHELRNIYRREVPAVLGNRPAELLTKADIRRMLDLTRQKSPNTERWLFAPLNGMFKWAIERGIVSSNPAADLTPPAPPVRRDRVLSQAELSTVLRAASGMGHPWRPFYLLLILTAARRNEVAGMRWAELDLENALWTIPGERTKNGQAHALELPQMAVGLLQGLPRSPSGYVLTTTERTPVSGYSKAKTALDAKLAELGEVAPWRIHDLRRTFATHAAEYLAIDEGVIERLLNHISTTQGGLKGVYQRQEYRAKRREAMEAWGRYVENLQAGSALAVSNA
jgi:integrase